jgi:hypothetical protein
LRTVRFADRIGWRARRTLRGMKRRDRKPMRQR